MALTLKRIGINREGTKLYLEDQSVYGDVNPERNSIAVIILGRAKRSAGDVSVDFDAYMPESVSEFTANLKHDCVHTFRMFNVDRDNGVVGSEGSITYRLSDSKLLKVEDGVQVEISQSDLWDSDLAKAELNMLVVSDSAKEKNEHEKILSEKLKAYFTGECDRGELARAQRNYNYIRCLFRGAWIDFCSGKYVLATEKLESLLKFANS